MIVITKQERGFNIFIENLEKKFNGRFEYVSGYINSNHSVLLRCNICKEESWKYCQIVRNNKVARCSGCIKKEREYKKAKNKKIKIKTIKPTSSLKELFILRCNQCDILFGYDKKRICYCSKKCKNKVHEYNKKIRKRNMHLNGDVDSSITLDKLIIRDDNICYLCGIECNSNDFTRDSNGSFIVGRSHPSIEHVKPISKGGTHTWDNVKLAHHYCNTLKNDSW